MIDLERKGYRTVVDPEEGWLLGERRIRPHGSKVAATLTFADPVEAQHLDGVAGQRRLGRETALHDVTVFVRRP